MKKARTTVKQKPIKLDKILVPIDFSPTAGNALRKAIQIAKVNKAKLKLVHIVTPVYMTSASSDSLIPWGDTFYKTIEKKATTGLKKMAEEIRRSSGIIVDYKVRLGVINSEICDMAKKENFDLIVMGTHGTTGFNEYFVGSNAYRVVGHSICPVLTVQKKSTGAGFKTIILPIRLERNSRQKVDYAAKIAQLFDATILVTGFTNEKSKSSQDKVKQYVNQVEKYLSNLNIKNKSKSIFADNFTKEMLILATKSKADLIVIMKEHDFSLDQLIKGPYAEQFVNHSKIPVLSIPVFSDPDMMAYSPYLSGQSLY